MKGWKMKEKAESRMQKAGGGIQDSGIILMNAG